MSLDKITFRPLILLILLTLLGPSRAQSQNPPQAITATGVVLPWLEVDLASKAEGIVSEVLVQEGQTVEKDQILARLDAKQEELETESFKVLAEKRKADYERALNLKGVETEKVIEDRRVEMEVAKANYELSKQKQEEKLIRSTLNGYMVRRLKDPGEAVQKLEQFAKLVSLEKVYVTIFLDGQYISRVKKGQPAEVKIQTFGDEKFTGVVDIVDPVVEPASGLFRVKISVENKGGRIRSGPKAEVKLTIPAN